MDKILIDKNLFLENYTVKPEFVNKSSAGKLLIVAGSKNFMGAAALSTLSALRSGSGYVSLATTSKVVDHVFPLAVEATYKHLKENEMGRIAYSNSNEVLSLQKDYKALLIGCGLGLDEDICKLVGDVVTNWEKPLVLDADALNALEGRASILKVAKGNIIITPHPGEMARLIGTTAEDVVNNRYKVAYEFSRDYGVTVVLKGYETIVAGEGKLFVWNHPNCGMAKAGSGDVLAGIIGSLCAQGMFALESAVCGVYLHGCSGRIAASSLSKAFMQPRDVIQSLSQVFIDMNL